jgi:hypothetical protein
MITYDVVGLIIDSPGEYDIVNDVTTGTTFKPGWHVNFIESHELIEPFLVYPVTPLRVFWGVETIFARFADEAEWLGVLEALEAVLPENISEEI